MERTAYPSDLNDEEWEKLREYIPEPLPGGRPAAIARREVVNGILYVLRTGCGWEYLPHDFPKWKTVYDYYRQWRRAGIWERANDRLREGERQRVNRNKQPSAAVIDSQSAQTTHRGGEKGFDAHKKVKGRKRHIVVDMMGNLLTIVVHAASLQDYQGAWLVFARLASKGWTRLQKIFGDGMYKRDKRLAEWIKKAFGWILEIVQRPPDTKGFQLLPKRWVVERTFSWITRNRRLSKDYELCPETTETWFYIAMSRLLVHRLVLNP